MSVTENTAFNRPSIEQMCADEAEARLDAYERGEIDALSGEEAIAWLIEQSSN
jgi:hypothetical protein